jgi:LuxR family maltose regulon positive regulatory protein
VSNTLLTTKLYIPQTRPNLVPRPRLIERLNQAPRRGHRLTLISAPAGFGKTTLLSAWVAGHKAHRRVGWVSLDEDDNDPLRFWSYVFTALPEIGQTAMAMLRSTSPPAIETILTALINAIAAQATPLTLVLDDYQAITRREIHEALGFLLDHLPPLPNGLHLVLATRLDPPLNVARLRVRDQLTELRADDLRFTLDEAATFINAVTGLPLAPQDVAALKARTEGWVAGLQVAAMAMRAGEDASAFVAAFTGSHRHVLSYLVEEVLQKQPQSVRSFLLQTSVLERLNGALCDALTGRDDGQAMLEQLEKANLFVVALDDELYWYRYHHLFKDVLCARRQRAYTAQHTQALHRRASEWYEQNGFVSEAVQHALLIDDFERVLELIDHPEADLLGRYELATVLRWLSALPDELVRASLNLSMTFAWALLASGQVDGIEGRLQDVERLLGAAAGGSPQSHALPPQARCTLAEASNIRANRAFHRSDLAAVLALSRQALGYLDDEVEAQQPVAYNAQRGVSAFNMALAHEFHGDVRRAAERFQESLHFNHIVGNWHLIPMATGHLAQVLQVQGQLRQAAETCQRAIQYTSQTGAPTSPMSGIAHTGLGHVLYEFNELARAGECLRRGIELARQWDQWEILTAGYLGLMRLSAAGGDWDKAQGLFQELDALLPELQAPWGHALVHAHCAWLHMRQGDLDAVRAWTHKTDLRADSAIVYLREAELIILARGLTVLEKTQEATHLLQRLGDAAEQSGRQGRFIEILALQALALQAQHQPQAALASLRRALALARSQGYVRLFVDEGQPMRALLSQFANSNATGLAAYVQRLLDAFCPIPPRVSTSRPSPSTPQPLAEPLSARELELLRLIAAGLTNRAIADELTVSVNTVKTHARNIYGKLGVRNRTEATTRARDLGLL